MKPEVTLTRSILRSGCLGASVLVASSAGAQTLAGVVSDSARRPLREAVVIVNPAGLRASTDSTGRFSVRLPRGGRVEVIVRLIGFRQFLDTVRVPTFGTERIAVRLERLPQRLAPLVITDRRVCAEFALSGFECRRDSGIGFFRDAGELRALNPKHWADMFDGMPGLRRAPINGRGGIDWIVVAPASRCLRQLYNGNMTITESETELFHDPVLTPNDVVAIEYYPDYRQIPPQYQRYAWWPPPPAVSQPCGLIVYWLRGADPRPRGR